MLVDLQEAEAAASVNNATPRSSIRLSCSINCEVPHLAPAIGAFEARYPQMLFDLSASDRFVDLVEEGLDLAIRIGDLGNPNLIARKIGQMRLVTAAAPACLERYGTPKRPQELVKHNCLTNEFASVKNHWPLLDRQRHELKIAVKGSAHASSGEMLATIAAQAVGIAHQPNFIVEPPFKTGRPVPILAKYQPALCHIYAV